MIRATNTTTTNIWETNVKRLSDRLKLDKIKYIHSANRLRAQMLFICYTFWSILIFFEDSFNLDATKVSLLKIDFISQHLILCVLTSCRVSDTVSQATCENDAHKLFGRKIEKLILFLSRDNKSRLTSKAPNTTATHAIKVPDALTTSNRRFPQPFEKAFSLLQVVVPSVQHEIGIWFNGALKFSQSAGPLRPQHCKPRWIPWMASALSRLFSDIWVQRESNPLRAAVANSSVYMNA